jgi:YtkA-like
LLALLAAGVLAVGGFFAWNRFHQAPTSAPGTVLATQTIHGLTVTVSSATGQLRNGDNELLIEFRDAGSRLVDVGTVKLELDMNMPGMVMHSAGTIVATGTSGRYRVKINPGMGGDWVAKVSYQGPLGTGEASFAVNVKP